MTIRTLRLRAGLTQRELGRLARLGTGQVAALETGARVPTLITALRIARVLGATVDYLAMGRGSPPSTRALRRAVADARTQAGMVAA